MSMTIGLAVAFGLLMISSVLRLITHILEIKERLASQE
jgi:hypothetical protein